MGCGANETLIYASAEGDGHTETLMEINFTRYFNDNMHAGTTSILHKVVL